MAAPNIVNVNSIIGKTFSGALTTTMASLVANAASSNQVFKINLIMVSNIDGTNQADLTIELNNAAGNGTARRVASTISVPADSTLVVVDKSTSFYLEEDQSIRGLASANGDLEVVISYDIIS